MTASVSLYRKYRSQNFDELVGQEPVVRTLQNAIRAGQISHAYLFTGPRGVGKTSAARLLARAANCLSESLDKPCNQCANCLTATRDVATDLIEIDAASNTGVDNIRDVIERANFAPSIWHTKFYIIDEVHMLSVSAFNALLKTLEEPPPHTAFILATTEIHKVPATVASRCQRFDFRRVPLQAMTDRLVYICEVEGIVAERDALELVSRQATGSLRDALSLLDQLRVYTPDGITLTGVQDLVGAAGSEKVAELVEAILKGDTASGLGLINTALDDGLDLRQFNREIVEHLRALLLVKSGAATGEGALLDFTKELGERLKVQAQQSSLPDILKWIKAFSDADGLIRSATLTQLPLEVALLTAILPSAGGSGSARNEESITRSPDKAGAVSVRNLYDVPRSAVDTKQVSPNQTEQLPGPAASEPSDLATISSYSNGRTKPAAVKSLGEPPADAGSAIIAIAEVPVKPVPDEVPQADPASEFERLKQLWPQVVEQINARSRTVGAVFRDYTRVRPERIDGSVCTISFKYPIHVARSREARVREVIETALGRVLGYSCRIESVLFDDVEGGSGDEGDASGDTGPPDKAGQGGTRERPSPYETTRGRAAMNIFGIKEFDETT